MQFSEERTGKFYVLSVSGRLDASTSSNFEEKLTSIIDSGEKNVLINFKELDYISSMGLRVLLQAAKKVKLNQGAISLCEMKDNILEVFDIAGFTQVFQIYKTYNEAVA
ncbi:MAG: STAS domain-containing protein [Melioribacteraceae bacterium]|nr:MAG: STAS domain-containing protein [Melioribacteraceae bacterium]